MMNLLHWCLLVAVADAGNISRAAERVGITQSGASQAIAQLEAALGFQVFARERRHIGVTALGEQVIEHARAMLARLDAIRVLADDSRGLSGGRIRLASFPSVISTLLPSLLRDFQRRHPGIELVALEGTDEEVEDWLAVGTVDLGVVLNPAPGRAEAVLGRGAAGQSSARTPRQRKRRHPGRTGRAALHPRHGRMRSERAESDGASGPAPVGRAGDGA